ncbi:hypothetical protein METSCH_C02100 [Metschnikowia aff. pulcherrima]|uniref:Uncharacterized protein n=1 Tax=Metschnikowia aff. pulcherrima TaxID=2163413 RepID=A0A4P6XR60_9ASCO|nr:hypothetical protein METSCH_C02100 [Metschnikowia aff. pulcherrima]
MKLILIAILTALGETMAINSVGSESESGTINKRFQFPKEKTPLDDSSNSPSNAPSKKIDWNQEGGTRMFMQNVPADSPNLDFKQVDDTRMFMQNVKVDGPNLDFIDEQSTENDVGKEASKLADETGGHELNTNREFGVPGTVEDWLDILRGWEKELPSLIKNMRVTQFWPIKNDYEDAVAEIKAHEGEEGPSAPYLQKFGQTFNRANQIAREICAKDPSVSGCDFHYPEKN